MDSEELGKIHGGFLMHSKSPLCDKHILLHPIPNYSVCQEVTYLAIQILNFHTYINCRVLRNIENQIVSCFYTPETPEQITSYYPSLDLFAYILVNSLTNIITI